MTSTSNTHVTYNVGLVVGVHIVYCEDLTMLLLKIAVSM